MKLTERFKKSTLANQTTIIFGAFVTVATVANTVGIVFQYQSAKESARESSAQTKKLIEAAQMSANAAAHSAAAESFSESAVKINEGMLLAVRNLGDQAKSTTGAARTAAESFHLGNQPWVAVKSIFVRDEPSERGNWVIAGEIQNTGPTPASNSQLAYSVLIQANAITDEKLLDLLAGEKWNDPGVIPPQGTASFAVELTNRPRNIPLNQLAFSAVTIYVIGKIRYEDRFGGTHLTTFCETFDSSTQKFILCHLSNTMK